MKTIEQVLDNYKEFSDGIIEDRYYCSSWDEDNECCVFDVLARELGVDDG